MAAFSPTARRIVEIEDHVPVMAGVQLQELLQVAVDQDRRLEHDPVGMALRLVEDVLLPPHAGGKRHDMALAQRVDRRVGHLGEHLPEIVVEAALPAGQHRHRRVVAHRGHRLLAGLAEHRDHLLDLLVAVAEELLVEEQSVVVEIAGPGRQAYHRCRRN